MKKTMFMLFALIVSALPVSAQTPADVTKNINAMKRDAMYIYAEATMKDLDEAYNGAKAILEMKVGDWVRTQHPDEGIEVCIVKAKEHFVQLETRRGDYYRAFVYVRKDDIMPVADRSEVTVFEVAPVESTQSTIISEEAPVEENKAVLELTPDEKQMLQVSSFYEVEPYIKELKSKGRLQNYGKYATMPVDDDCHMFVYDKQGNISALIRKSGQTQYNLNTLKEDNVKNYKNCGAIWFQLK
ncbi:MAG: hypothetical protein IJV36_02075 [Prevotella sp.]|nr:hypothetical protein [Prevotella sp.]